MDSFKTSSQWTRWAHVLAAQLNPRDAGGQTSPAWTQPSLKNVGLFFIRRREKFPPRLETKGGCRRNNPEKQDFSCRQEHGDFWRERVQAHDRQKSHAAAASAEKTVLGGLLRHCAGRHMPGSVVRP
ncbi:hypothetical protein [Desulfovibrio sp. SGI.169]|uniref:hypothetical protein n=1 Tax=Desulfovibrio sp. SGI.169 TaxID=3420561 RepID=UPI003CFE707D